MSENKCRQLTPDEEVAVALLVYEYVQLKERNATDEEMANWRQRVRERFPDTKDVLFGQAAKRLSRL